MSRKQSKESQLWDEIGELSLLNWLYFDFRDIRDHVPDTRPCTRALYDANYGDDETPCTEGDLIISHQHIEYAVELKRE